jgi:small-conductance mechanosensitive channel
MMFQTLAGKLLGLAAGSPARSPLAALWLWQAEVPAQTPAPTPPPAGAPVTENVDWYARIWNSYLNRQFKIGDALTITAAGLVFAVLILCAAYLASRWLQRLLETRFAARTHLDPGVQYTIQRLAHYLIVIVGGLAALAVGFGVNVTSLAVIFTALSVGIGFGLQFIAGDIASGFILLFERPVRIGDFISIGVDSKLVEGKVRNINLRTTTVLTNDHIAVIVPNSKLVNDNLINWSYADRRARLSIPVGVAYGSDVDLVSRLLLEAAEGVDHVLESPKPSVQLMEFGESSLDFRLLVWTDRPRRNPQIKSNIRFRMLRLFREAGIEIPFPQRDLNVRGGRLRVATGHEADETREPDTLFEMDEEGNLTRG